MTLHLFSFLLYDSLKVVKLCKSVIIRTYASLCNIYVYNWQSLEEAFFFLQIIIYKNMLCGSLALTCHRLRLFLYNDVREQHFLS